MKHPLRTVELKYEELLYNPAQTLKKVCDFIGVLYETEMLNFHQTSDKFVDYQHSELIFRPLDPSNTRKWVKSFTPFELKKYDFFSRKTLRMYGYPVTELRVSLVESISIIAEFIIFLPLRIIRIVKIALNMKVASKFGLAYDHEKDIDYG